MAFETKAEVLERILSQEKAKCPHCGVEMQIWEVPQIGFEEGSGWGTPYLFVCFNNRCPMYMQGWDHIHNNYGRHASYRCICYPGTNHFEYMAVFSPIGGTGQIVDPQVMAKQRALKAVKEREFSALADCVALKNWHCVLKILLDTTKSQDVRFKAAEIIGDIGELEAIEPIKNQSFDNNLMAGKIEDSILKIHIRHFTRECPFCGGIIKKRAKICKHCGKVLPSYLTDSSPVGC